MHASKLKAKESPILGRLQFGNGRGRTCTLYNVKIHGKSVNFPLYTSSTAAVWPMPMPLSRARHVAVRQNCSSLAEVATVMVPGVAFHKMPIVVAAVDDVVGAAEGANMMRLAEAADVPARMNVPDAWPPTGTRLQLLGLE